jgi:uncharacterized membrane protein YgaE (UPF0421/DUF939 family)
MINKEHKHFLFFVLECLVGTIIGFIIYLLFPVVGAWSLFSIILVLAPDRKDAISLAKNRIRANLIGALVGLLLCYFQTVTLPLICVGIIIAMLLCEWLKLNAVSKSAIVAILIITMHDHGRYFWDIAVERAGEVMLGCIIGVLLTYIFHSTRTHASKVMRKFRERV